MVTQAGQAKRALCRTRAGLAGLLAVALVASSQVASAAPKDKVEVLDGSTLDDPSRKPKPVPERSRCASAAQHATTSGGTTRRGSPRLY
jgi:hypothetical protein